MSAKKSKKSLNRKLKASSNLRNLQLKKMSREVLTKQIIPLGMSPVADRNGYDIYKVVNEYITCNDDSHRQQMLLDGIIDSVEENGELLPVVSKRLDAAGNVVDYTVWDGVLEPNNRPIVLEHRKKKDGSPYLNTGKPIRPWWQTNLFAIRKSEEDTPELCRIQLNGDALDGFDASMIPWFRPCEIVLRENWTLNVTREDVEGEKPFVRQMEDDAEIENFLGQTEMNDVVLIDLMKNLTQIYDSDIPVFSDLSSAQPNNWQDFYCAEVKVQAKMGDFGQFVTIADATLEPGETVSCSRYSNHVVEQLVDTEGGAYAYVFFRPKIRKGKTEKVEYVLYGALVFEYVQVEPAEEQP